MSMRFRFGGGGRPRPAGHVRRTKPVRRRSAGLSRVRAGGVLAMVASALAIYGAASSGAVAFRQLDLSGERFTAESTVRSTLGVQEGANLFALSTDELRTRLEALPTVARAEISIGLPETVAVHVVERAPIVGWAVGENRFLVDASGAIFAEVPVDTTDARIAAALQDLPVVVDERSASASLAVGSTLDATDFDVARRLGSLRPADLGSGAGRLVVAATDADGWVVRPVPAGWSAVLGFYTPTIRPPDLIPGQVRLLRSLLAGHEALIGRVVLASDTEGTYLPRASGKPGSAGGPPRSPGAIPSPNASPSP